jgi:RNA polymerase sigma-70 factor (ECF subfamily)
MRLTANQSEAEDITQEVFLRAYERFGELHDSPTVAGWLKTVARNLSLNHLTRYRSRWSFFSEMFRGDEGEDEPTMDFPATRRHGPARVCGTGVAESAAGATDSAGVASL